MSDLAERLGKSGVKYRCECGVESQYQREAKVPGSWTLTFRSAEGRTWPTYFCGECNLKQRHIPTPEERDIEAWRRKKASAAERKRKRK